MEMVEAPRLGPSALRRTAASSRQSTPQWLQNRASSEAISARDTDRDTPSSGTATRSTRAPVTLRQAMRVETGVTTV